ncbi:carboxylesterase/lipase family protein [Demequina sp.]|uniref:carboxylesterase/lipase family protein n=1 Tax=Demequina sp. TaxID=2050685 RepID=UPI003D0B7644
MASPPPVVSTASGRVEGVWRSRQWPDATVTQYATFRGIPYAKAPVGEARFDAPRPVEEWEGVREAHDFGATPQLYSPYSPPRIPEPSIAGEDTLSVNVTTPDPSADAGLPVLVWIHGGGFEAGSAASPWYVGEAFARDGVVTVTASYRLGFEGFGWVEGAVNNRAVRDWMAALEWVQRNIAAFGGDPSRVTIAGQSAGGAAVMRLLTLPAAQHLFRAVMAISPGDPSVTLARARRAAGRVAAAVGAAPYLEALRDVPSRALFDARGHFRPQAPDMLTRLAVRSYRPMLPGPVVDGDVVPQSVDAALIAGVGRDKTLYMGSTAHEFNEAALPFAPLLAGQHVAPLLVRAGLSSSLAQRAAQDASRGTGWAVGQVVTDATFRCHVANWGVLRGGATAPTWVYDFRWESTAPGVHGAAHCVDVPFGFDILDAEGVAEAVGDAPPSALADAVHGDWLAVINGEGVKAADHRDRFSTIVYGADASRAEQVGAYAFERELATHLDK